MATVRVEFIDWGKVPFRSYSLIGHFDPENNDATDTQTLYVVTEKIHGSNFQFVLTKDGDLIQYRCATRNNGLNRISKFFGFQDVCKTVESSFPKIYEDVVAYCKSIGKPFDEATTSISIFCEIFGGKYDGKTNPKASKVQGDANYSPDTLVAVIDIRVNYDYMKELPSSETLEAQTIREEHTIWINQKTAFEIVGSAGMMHTPIIMIAPWIDVLKIDINKFVTKVPSILGLKEIPDNFGEGVVVRMLCDGGTRRSIAKWKHIKYDERPAAKALKMLDNLHKKPKQKSKKEPTEPKAVNGTNGNDDTKADNEDTSQSYFDEVHEIMVQYVNDNRFNSYFSKHESGFITDFKNFYAHVAAIMRDIKEDIEKNTHFANEQEFSEYWKYGGKRINRIVVSQLPEKIDAYRKAMIGTIIESVN